MKSTFHRTSLVPLLACGCVAIGLTLSQTGCAKNDDPMVSLGKKAVAALRSGEAQTFDKSVCLSVEEYREALARLSMITEADMKRVLASADTDWRRERVAEGRAAAFNTVLQQGRKAGVHWDRATFKSVKHRAISQPSEIAPFFSEFWHLETKPIAIYVAFSDGSGSYECRLDDCIKGKGGWKSASGIRWSGDTDASAKRDCLRNLNVIDAAKDNCALEKGLATGAPVTAQQLAPYLKQGESLDTLKCPSRGTYSIDAIGKGPTCSIHGTLETSDR